jgi:hypothetical protein
MLSKILRYGYPMKTALSAGFCLSIYGSLSWSFSHPLSYPPSLASGLVPDGHRYYEGSDCSAEHQKSTARRDLPAYLD